MFEKQTIRDIKFKGKTVLVRVDYNVPMKDGKVTSDLRIRASLPTIESLINEGAKKIILISHLGRPEGMKNPELSLRPVAEALGGLVNVPVKFISDVSGPDVEDEIKKAPNGSIVLLENLRFWPGEEKNLADFAREIVESTHADFFVQDGFAVIHRAHASTEAITHELPSVAGLLVEKEVSVLTSAISNPKQPVLVIIGGAKVDDKEPLISKFLGIAENIFVGGKIAADGYKSESPKISVAVDFVEDEEGNKCDIGPESVSTILEMVGLAETVIWNGTVGLVEKESFDKGSVAIAEAIGKRSDVTSIICGGDTSGFVEGLQALKPELKYSLVSTGGGASLELLSGLELPGLSALLDK